MRWDLHGGVQGVCVELVQCLQWGDLCWELVQRLQSDTLCWGLWNGCLRVGCDGLLVGCEILQDKWTG